MLIIRFNPKDCHLLNMAKFLYEQMLNDRVYENINEKQIILICHVERPLGDYKLLSDCIPYKTISYCSDWNFAFIDNLNGKICRSITEIYDKNYCQLFTEKIFSEFEIIKKIIYPVFIKIEKNLEVLNNNIERDYFERICSLILSNK